MPPGRAPTLRVLTESVRRAHHVHFCSVFWTPATTRRSGRLSWPASKKRLGTKSREVWHPPAPVAALARGVGGAKGEGRGECESAKHGPGTVPGNRVTGAETHAESRENITTRRHTPEVGAVCPNWARTDLCGGREVTRSLLRKWTTDGQTALVTQSDYAAYARRTASYHQPRCTG